MKTKVSELQLNQTIGIVATHLSTSTLEGHLTVCLSYEGMLFASRHFPIVDGEVELGNMDLLHAELMVELIEAMKEESIIDKYKWVCATCGKEADSPSELNMEDNPHKGNWDGHCIVGDIYRVETFKKKEV